MNVGKEYEAVNSALAMFEQEPIAILPHGTDREKVEFLLNTYAEKLKRNVPTYRIFSDNRLHAYPVDSETYSIL